MRRKLMVLIMTLVMAGSMAMTAFAAAPTSNDGVEPVAPKDDTRDVEVSSGKAVITGDGTVGDGTTFNTSMDDDNLPNAEDKNGADINVWARVLDKSTPMYKIDIAWGAMKFEYNSGQGTWNTATHEYDNGGGTAEWTVTGYLDDQSGNNKIDVTNHSNAAIEASFAYAMTNENLFNNDATKESAVKGNFFKTSVAARTAATVLDNSTLVTDKLPDSKIKLHTADDYSSAAPGAAGNSNVFAGPRTESVYFAFSGRPDEGKGAVLNTFKKVGVITVTVSKADTTDFEWPFVK